MFATVASTLAVATGNVGGMMDRGPLGKYASIAALLVAIGTIAAAVVYRIVRGQGDATLDGWAYLSIGVVLGTTAGVYGGRQEGQTEAAATINGLAGKVDALHRRMDVPAVAPGSGARGDELSPQEVDELRRILATSPPAPTG